MIETTELKTKTWQSCIDRWLSTRQSENTQRSYRNAVKDFEICTGMDVSQATKRDMMAWVEVMKERELRPATINARVMAISSLYKFAQDFFEQDISNPTTIRKVLPKVERYEQSRALEPGDVQRLLAAIEVEKLTGLRDYALILGYFLLAMRNSEWRLVTVADFELRDSGIFFRWSGKGQTGVMEVQAELWSAMQIYIQATGGRGILDYIFLDRSGAHPISERRMGQIVKRYARIAGIVGRIRVHDLRHTAAMLQREAGADVEELRDFMRHKSIVTTQIYLHRMDRRQSSRARKVVESLGLIKS